MSGGIHYVYIHVDPRTCETVYVGKGVHGRAWDATRNRGTNPKHLEWMLELAKQGYTPDEWVVIINKGLTDKEALKQEKDYLHKIGRTKFNMQGGERNHMAKLTDLQALEIYRRAKAGEPHAVLAREFGVCRPNISMIATRKQWRVVTAGE